MHAARIVDVHTALSLMECVDLGPNLSSLFGELLASDVCELSAAPGTVAGWLLSWEFTKPCRDQGAFLYTVNAFVCEGQLRSVALEVIHDAFRRFALHELREGFLFKGRRVFEPHPRTSPTFEGEPEAGAGTVLAAAGDPQCARFVEQVGVARG